MSKEQEPWLAWVERLRGADEAQRGARVQRLWGGYGELVRVHLTGSNAPDTVIVKRVSLPPAQSERGHLRKLRSYEVERSFYQRFAPLCLDDCRVPRLLGAAQIEDAWCLALEDLDLSGFTGRRVRTLSAIEAGVSWLACFHATFMGVQPEGLWPVGTYWHLSTRPDELEAMTDQALRRAAPAIDARLNAAKYQTLVHGDAKLDNLCFAASGAVAAVDFQYVGGGCGVKDLAYFMGSVLSGDALSSQGDALRERYFLQLGRALEQHKPELDRAALEREWRALYPWAWADFERFLDGWSPGRRDRYAQQQLDEVMRQLHAG